MSAYGIIAEGMFRLEKGQDGAYVAFFGPKQIAVAYDLEVFQAAIDAWIRKTLTGPWQERRGD